MADMLKFTIKADPRTKKNSLMIAGSGKRCPRCTPSKKPMAMTRRFVSNGLHLEKAFYGDQAPYETATYGYMVFVKSKFGGPTQYGYTAALSLMGVIIVYPLTLLIKYLMEKGDRINAN